MKNKAIDLHNILFEQLERLNDLDFDDKETTSEKIANEIRRADMLNKTAKGIIENGRLQLDAIRVSIEAPDKVDMPDMLKSRQEALPLPGDKK